MIADFRDRNYWAVILGGSSGFGLASAKKLAGLGIHLCVVHRDRRGNMAAIEREFDAIRAQNPGTRLLALNVDALSDEGRAGALDALQDALREHGGRVRVLLHSIAFGNLKLLHPRGPAAGATRVTSNAAEPGAAEPGANGQTRQSVTRLARELSLQPAQVAEKVEQLFAGGDAEFLHLAQAPRYSDELLLEDEDIAQTIYAMGTSLVSWVRDISRRALFADDARVVGLTSEGNQVAWRGYAAVSAAKAALEAISRSIALEFAPQLRSNILQPGVTDTPALRLIPGSPQMLAAKRMANPMGRTTLPEDVANVVALLASDEAAWINGTVIRVDGGECIAG
jgi:NAD(P)-dependent dehydrogenase (short-subunit alcohol dehydrogenase family)